MRARDAEIYELAETVHRLYGADGSVRGELRMARSRWEESAERKGAESALRKAAEWIAADPGRTSGIGVAEWLTSRADRIARGER